MVVKSASAPHPNEARKQSNAKKEVTPSHKRVNHSSVVLGDLPADVKVIYHRTVRQMMPTGIQKSIPTPELIQEADGATMIFEVEGKRVAEAMHRRLQNAHVYGKRWKVEYHPVSAVSTASDATVVDVTLNPSGLPSDALQTLQSVQGFLALDSSQMQIKCDADEEEQPEKRIDGESVVKRLVAVFAEEGAAIHARAVLSGRLIGNRGTRMFLRVRRNQAQ